MDASDIALASVVVALLSLVAAVWQGRVNATSIRREQADREEQLDLLRRQVDREESARLEELGLLRRQVEREERARKEELELLRRQVEALAEQRRERRRASLTASPGPRGGTGRPEDVEYHFVIHNTGAVTARRVSVWLANASGERLSRPASTTVPVLPGGPGVGVRVELPRAVGVGDVDLRLFASWEDDDGAHETPLDVDVEPLRM